jgi:putative polymerase
MPSFRLKYSLKQHESASSDALSNYAILLLFSALLYQTFFCFVNTHFFRITPSLLILTEMFLLAGVMFFFIRGPISLRMLSLLILVFANAFVLVIFQQYFDPKTIRNLMIPILIIWLGVQYNNKIPADTLLKYLTIIVILVGLLEFFLPTVYQMLFNVIEYQVATGRASDLAVKYTEGGFSMNGTRWGGRHLLSFLGDHRTSSVFLETVNIGNFGVLIACWGLSKKSIKSGLFFIIAAFIVAILADSRFASTLITLMLLMRLFLPLRALEVVAYLSPLLILLVCFSLYTPVNLDDFKSRLGSTGYYILNFKASELFGLSNYHYSMFVDQGYAYLFHFSGLTLALIMWISFCRLKMSSNEGLTFKCLIGVLIAANLAISGDSIFAFKWVAILWFLLGTQVKNINRTIEVSSETNSKI